MHPFSIWRTAAVALALALPLAGHAAIVTLDMAAVLSGNDGDPPAGSLTGSLDYETSTGAVVAARLLISLGTDDPFELTTIDPESGYIAKETKPIIVAGDVKGESSDKGHKGQVEILFTQPDGPSTPTFGFTGTFVDTYETAVFTYGVRGVATLAVPEPSTHALLAMGMAAMVVARRRKHSA
jgi:PEP-CTERM motif